MHAGHAAWPTLASTLAASQLRALARQRHQGVHDSHVCMSVCACVPCAGPMTLRPLWIRGCRRRWQSGWTRPQARRWAAPTMWRATPASEPPGHGAEPCHWGRQACLRPRCCAPGLRSLCSRTPPRSTPAWRPWNVLSAEESASWSSRHRRRQPKMPRLLQRARPRKHVPAGF